MSLTKQAFLQAAKARFEWVDVPGFGRVGLRSLSHVQASHRELSFFDATGQAVPDEIARAEVYAIIDQVMTAPDAPMFSEDDAEELCALDNVKLQPLLDALARFNGNEKKTPPGGSNATAGS